MILTGLPCISAVCFAKDVDVWYAGGADGTASYLSRFESSGYRLVYSGHYLTSTDLRVNAITIRDSTIKSTYVMNVLPRDLPHKPGFCINTISAHTNSKDYITAEYEACDGSYLQAVWTGMSTQAFIEKAAELHLGSYNLRGFAAYGCKHNPV